MVLFLNALNFLGVVLGFVFQILLMRAFGASSTSDLYYLTTGITLFISSMLSGFLTDLFIPIYTDERIKGYYEAQRLTGGVLSLGIIGGILTSAVTYFAAPLFVRLFAGGMTPEQLSTATMLLRIVALTITFTTITAILNAALNANLFLSTTYLANLLIPVANLFALIIFGKSIGLQAIMASTLIASAVTTLIVLAYCKKKIGARPANPFSIPALRYLLWKNIPVRTGIFFTMLRVPITTTVLSFFPAGSITTYSYADKIISTIYGITNSPLGQVLFIKSAKLFAEKKIDDLRELFRRTVRTNSMVFLFSAFFVGAVFEILFGVLFSSKVSPSAIHTMFLFFIALIPYYFLSTPAVSFSNVILAEKKGRIIFYVSALNTAAYAGVLFLTRPYFNLYGLPFAMAIAQALVSLVFFFILRKNIHLRVIRDLSVLITPSVAILILLVAVHVFNQRIHTGIISLGLLLLWIAVERAELYHSIQDILRKGEVR